MKNERLSFEFIRENWKERQADSAKKSQLWKKLRGFLYEKV